MLTFPTLHGLTWDCKPKPTFRGITQVTATGVEYSWPTQDSLQWSFELSYEFLPTDLARSTPSVPGTPQYSDFDNLVGFFAQCQGPSLPFLFNPTVYTRRPSTNQVEGHIIGVGDGTTTVFQLARQFGGYTEPLQNPVGPVLIYLNGVLKTTGWSLGSFGQITFTSAPAAGVKVTASFAFMYACKFDSDYLDLQQFMLDLYEGQQITIHQTWQRN